MVLSKSLEFRNMSKIRSENYFALTALTVSWYLSRADKLLRSTSGHAKMVEQPLKRKKSPHKLLRRMGLNGVIDIYCQIQIISHNANFSVERVSWKSLWAAVAMNCEDKPLLHRQVMYSPACSFSPSRTHMRNSTSCPWAQGSLKHSKSSKKQLQAK